MGILDDAIREHLDLKRKHGSRDAELREIEDEAFGQGDQPDPFVGGELYTGAPDAVDTGNEEPTRLVDAEVLQPTEEPPESVPSLEPASEPEAFRPAEPAPEPEALRPPEPTPDLPPETSDQAIAEPPSPIPGQVELPGQDEIPGQERLDAEPEADAEPEVEAPSPSESLEELIAEEEPFPEDSGAPPPVAEVEPEPESRPLEPQADAQAPPEPESAVPDPPPPPPEPGTEPPGRARGRVDVPTQEHPPPGETGDVPPLPGDEPELGRPDTTYEPPPIEPPSDEAPLPVEEPISDEQPLPDEAGSADSNGPQLYDFESDEDPASATTERPAVEDDFEALGPAEEESPYLDEEEPYSEEPASGVETGGEGIPEEPGTEVRPAVEDEEPAEGRSFDTEEHFEEDDSEEGLWFEKGPPKDFDFDD
jgi:hypothetical protein